MELIPVSNIIDGTMFIWTEIWLTVGILVLLLMSMSPKLEQQRDLTGAVALTFVVTAAGILYYTNVLQRPLRFPGLAAGPMDMGNDNQMLFVDGLGTFFKFLLLFSGGATVLISSRSKQLLKNFHAEFQALILTLVIGGMLMVTSMDLLMIYLAIEFVSIISYVMPGLQKANPKAAEASAKYMIYGGVTSGLMIFGMSYLYGITGSTSIFDIKEALIAGVNRPAALLGVLLFMSGLGYKISIVPFHFWAPDVYQGAPTPVTAFFSVAPKAAGFGLLIRIVDSMLTTTNPLSAMRLPTMAATENLFPPAVAIASVASWYPFLYWCAIFTMLVGNLAALGQKSAKRMLAYSSIAHAGYMLMGVLVLTPRGYASITFYLAVYTVMNLGAFYVVQLVEETKKSDDIDAFRGLLKTTPWLAIAMCILLFSLTGLPPFSGFLGKYFVFTAVVDAYVKFKDQQLLILAVVGVLTSVVSLFYYARIVVAMMKGVSSDDAHAANPGDAHSEGHGHHQPEPEPELTTVKAGAYEYGVLYALFVLPTVGLIVKFDLLSRLTDTAVYVFGK